MSSLKILISGAGITGPIVAHFLAQSSHNHEITIIERSPSPRLTGQNVDVRGNGLEVIRRMSPEVEAAIRSKTTNEQGLQFIDSNNKVWASFSVNEGQGFTSEIEIMRGDLASILYESTKNLPNVKYIFDEHITSLTQNQDDLTVSFANNHLPSPSHYDILIGSDGWASQTRHLAFPPSISQASIHSLNQYTAYFTIPYDTTDGTWAQWHNSPGGRLLLLRPDPTHNVTRVWLSSMSQLPLLESTLSQPIPLQKQTLTSLFTNIPWSKTARILKGMQTSSDFYYQKIAQIKLPSWSVSRVVLVGDAGYAPSPISGMGTTVGMTGAYILAGEINRCPKDPEEAFRRYEAKMRGFVGRAQKLMPGTPGLANPQSQWGIWVLNWFLWVVMVTGLNRFASISGGEGVELSDYGLGVEGKDVKGMKEDGKK